MRLLKLSDKRTGWLGEGCTRTNGRRFIKRYEHRHNRHVSRAAIRKENCDG